MIVYKNPWTSYPCYFVKVGKAHTSRMEANASSGYRVYQINGKWICKKSRQYDQDLKTGGYQIAGETKCSIQTVIDNAIINAVLDAVNEKTVQGE